MRDHSKHIELSRDDAVATMLEHCDFSARIEDVPVEQSYGRILAEDALAHMDLPNCLTCCMDSIAVHWEQFENGMPDTTQWVRGVDWEFANTGVGMPEGFDTAIVIEHVQVSDDEQSVTLDAAPTEQYAGTREAGSKMKKGDVLVDAGTRITPLLAAHIAGGGNTTVACLARPVVAFIPTGNELVQPGTGLPRGMNIESNSILVRGKIEEWGGLPLMMPLVPDNQQRIEASIHEACRRADIVVLNAGSSKGSDDWSMEILDRIGTVFNHETNHGPGHHSSYALVDGTPIVGISGPPGGAAFTTDFYLKPLMLRWEGQEIQPVRVKVRLAQAFAARKKPTAQKQAGGETRPPVVSGNRKFFGVKQLSVVQAEDGMLEARPAPSGRPGPVEAEAQNAYFLLENGSGAPLPQAGDIIEVELR